MGFGFLLAALLAVSPASFQNCSVNGTLTDPQGYVISGAEVIARNASGVEVRTQTDTRGVYCFPDLSNGGYRVTVFVPGFARVSQSVVFNGSPLQANAVLQVAQVANGVTVTAMRGDERDSTQVVQSTNIVTQEDILRRPSRILPDILREEAGIHVQQTTTGQGTPFLRGLMGNRILVMLDGVRFNNSTFRLGPIQYLGTIDPTMVERVEVVKGPGSVLYGSDAMGGVINVIRKDRQYTPELQTNGRFMTQFASADLSTTVRSEVGVTAPRFVFAASGTFQKFNNLRAGGGRYTHSAEARFVTNNPEGTTGRQAPTGYEQYGADVSLKLRIRPDQDLTFVYQRFNQFDVPRYDQLAGGNGNLRYQFDPQTRDLFYADYVKTRWGFVDSFRANASYQSQPETRRIQQISSGRAGNQVRDWSDTDTLGFMAQALTNAGERHAIAFGGETYLDFVESEIETTDIQTGAVTSTRGRFPKDSRYRSFGLFLQDDIRVADSLHLMLGGRASLFQAKADDIGIDALLASLGSEVPAGLPGELDFVKSDLTGNVGLVWTPTDGLHFGFNVGRAFRAPNINDFGGIGLTGVRFEIPAPTLRPETLVTYEFSTKLDLERAYVTLSLYDSEIRDLIERIPGNINGQTTIGNAQVLQRTNFGRARILGMESAAQVRFGDKMLWGNFSHVSGRNISSGDYLSFEGGMPPTQGWLGWKWEPVGRRYWFETYSQFAMEQDRISGIPVALGGRFNGSSPSADAVDARMGAYRTRSQIVSYRQYHGISLDGGTLANGETIVPVSEIENTLFNRSIPGFATWNIRGGFRISEMNRLHVMIENILDRNYRLAGSGIDAPGINLRIGFETRF